MRYDVITIGMHCSVVFVWYTLLLHGCVEEGNRNDDIGSVVRRRAGRRYRGMRQSGRRARRCLIRGSSATLTMEADHETVHGYYRYTDMFYEWSEVLHTPR
jgi:hypothetical protein